MKSDYVKLEPRSKEIFETSDVFTMDSSVQVIYTKMCYLVDIMNNKIRKNENILFVL